MNYTIGILAFILLYIPAMAILIWMHIRNREIDREYIEKMKEINKRYGVE